MNKKELEKRIDNFILETRRHNALLEDELKDFIFDELIPEVLKSSLDENNSDVKIGYEVMSGKINENELNNGYFFAEKRIKERIKKLYNIKI